MCPLDEGSCRLGSRVLQGDRDQLEGGAAVLLVEVLPPGQLFTAPSPGAPEEQEEGFPAQIAQPQRASIQAGQRQIGQLIPDGDGGITHASTLSLSEGFDSALVCIIHF
jgi:hypothetical protein